MKCVIACPLSTSSVTREWKHRRACQGIESWFWSNPSNHAVIEYLHRPYAKSTTVPAPYCATIWGVSSEIPS